MNRRTSGTCCSTDPHCARWRTRCASRSSICCAAARPSTATRLADRLDLNSGATSYHLRQLAAAGLIAEAAELGNKRDRWWQATYRSTYFDVSSYESDPEAAMAYLNAIASSYARRTIEFGYAFPTLPTEWSASATMSDFRLRLTADEGRQLLADLAAVVASYPRDDDVEEGAVEAPAGAARIVVQLQLMPQLEASATELPVEDQTAH